MNSLSIQVLLWFSASGTLAEFVVSPSSFNASEGSNVTFHCHINESGNLLFWLVNDEFSNSIANRNRSISLVKYSNLRSILTIPAHTWNDNVEIQCAYRSIQSTSLNCSDPTVSCSRKAILKIQGLLSPPLNFNAQRLHNLALYLTWEQPPSLDLTGIDSNIILYEISVFNNITGQTENLTVHATNFTYYVHPAHGSDLCRALEFSVLAVNAVGRGSKSTIKIAPQEAPNVKLLDIKNAVQSNTELECTTTCNNLVTWTLHTQLEDGNDRSWYEVIVTNHSGNLCTESIALTPIWIAQSVNAVSVQCVAVSVCPSEVQTGCVQGVCISNIQDVFIGEFNQDITNVDAKKGLICGSSVFLTALGLIVIVLAILIARAGITRRLSRRCESTGMKEERIYESPTELTGEEVDRCNTNLELCTQNPGSLYSLPLPTDPCPAYDTFMKEKRNDRQ